MGGVGLPVAAAPRRGACLALLLASAFAAEASRSPSFCPALAAALRRPGVGGWSRRRAEELEPMGGYGVGPEIDRCTKELALARALMACGDEAGLGRETLQGYARDPRGVFAEHANAVLRGHGVTPEHP